MFVESRLDGILRGLAAVSAVSWPKTGIVTESITVNEAPSSRLAWAFELDCSFEMRCSVHGLK